MNAETTDDAGICADGTVGIPQAAELTGLPRSTLYMMMTNGTLPFVQIGKRRLLPRRALTALLERHVVREGRAVPEEDRK